MRWWCDGWWFWKHNGMQGRRSTSRYGRPGPGSLHPGVKAAEPICRVAGRIRLAWPGRGNLVCASVHQPLGLMASRPSGSLQRSADGEALQELFVHQIAAPRKLAPGVRKQRKISNKSANCNSVSSDGLLRLSCTVLAQSLCMTKTCKPFHEDCQIKAGF